MDMKLDDIKSLLNLCEKSEFSYFKLLLHEAQLEFGRSGSLPGTGDGLSQDGGAGIHENNIVIKSDFIGRITLREEFFQLEGSIYIEKDEPLCEIEAMKMQHSVISPVSGELMTICVKNGEMVEFGTDLFVIKAE